MTTIETGEITLEQVREHVWEIPQTGEMRVPGRVLASEALLEEITQDRSLQQLRDTTHLPGIQQQAICMPDGHQGYGFPVGGVAALDAETGCISPGAVGYDINCVAGESEVRLSFGRRIRIDDLADRFENEQALVAGDSPVASPIRLFTESGEKTVYELTTTTGECIETTGGHEFHTPDGMVALTDLSPGATVSIQPFRGLSHEEPADRTLLTETAFSDEPPRLRRALTERGLLPLSTADAAFHRLLSVLGFFTGNGSFAGSERTCFYGDAKDLERLRADIEAIGFTASAVSPREQEHTNSTGEGTDGSAGCEIETTSKAFRVMLRKLGAQSGTKVEPGGTTPWYFDQLTSWQTALYYSAYFDTAMTAPSEGRASGLAGPTVSQTRSVEAAAVGERFLADLAAFLEAVGVETTEIERNKPGTGDASESVRLRLGIENDDENLRRFFTTVGYRYSGEKQRKAAKAIQYLKHRSTKPRRRRQEQASNEARALADGGNERARVTATATAADIGTDECRDWDGDGGDIDSSDRAVEQRPWQERGFEAFCETVAVGPDMTVATEVETITEAGTKPVYDIGVAHAAHNFLANEFVVSNCGVRMVRTNLQYEDVSGREEALVDRLFEAIPTGLGGGGVAEVSGSDVETILERGVEWAVENGYGVQSDLAHCEDEGVRPEADAGLVSKEAKDRGANQVGSLGSGNHFLEVQRVTDIYRDGVAAEFGLSPDQIVVLIHCGSRGLGHQVCADYLRAIEQTHQGLLDQLPSKELAAAPAGSRLAQEYYAAMAAAINFAWVNRQLITHQTRQVFQRVFDRSWEAMEMELLYDVAHNIAKRESHTVEGSDRELFVHRKGATRAFPAGRPELPPAYRAVGQPVIIPGSMGAGSYILRGGDRSLAETFGSTAHGAGRLMSRTQAKNEYWGGDVADKLEQEHVYVKAESGATIAEEAPGVYKDIDEVVRVSDALGIGDRVARTYPVCNIKG